MLPATDDMLMMAPPPRSIMPGSTARIVRTIAFTLRSSANSRSASFISRIEPAWTKPAQLNSTSIAPISATAALTAAVVEHVEASRRDIGLPGELGQQPRR